MTKETTYTTHEDDSSDDTSKESRSKKTTKISRAVPLPVSLETDTSVKEVTPKPVLSFGERFMQELQKRSAHEQERLEAELNKNEEDDDDEEDDGEAPILTSTPARDAQHESDSPKKQEDDALVRSHVDETPHDTYVAETYPIDALDAANWEHEPDVVEDITDDSPSTDEAEPVFVDVPHDGPETDNEVTLEEVEPELLASGLGSEGPPEPPEAISDGPTHPEFGPEGRHTMVPVRESAWYNPVAREAGRAEAQDDADALYRAEKHGLRRGLTAGLLFGWMFGRRGKKHAAEQHEKELKIKDKEVVSLKNEQILARQRIEAMQRTQESLRANIGDNSPRVAQGPENVPQSQARSAESTPVAQGENISIGDTEALQNKPRLKAAEIVAMAAAEVVAVNETSPGAAAHEAIASEKPKKSIEVRPSLPEEQEITEETYTTSKDRKVESSAWHRIEIDAKTGRPILDPEVAYGEEFKREQRQEIWKDKTGDADQKASTGILGSLATGALSGSLGRTDDSVYKESAKDDNLHVPALGGHASDLHAGNQILRYASSPVVWVVAVTIVVFLFIVGFVL